MIVFIKMTRTAFLALGLLVAVLLCPQQPAFANERMAGSPPRKDIFNTQTQNSSGKPPAILDVNIEHLESRGLLHDVGDGGFGPYLWEYSSKKDIFRQIENLPPQHQYEPLFDLGMRTLMARIDPAVMSAQGETNTREGRDFLTLRLEKLMEAGQFGNVAALYKLGFHEPYHERLARTGVTALLLGKSDTLACLEIKAIFGRFESLPFWQKTNAVCNKVLLKQDTDPEALALPEDDFLLPYLQDEEKRFTPESSEDLTQPAFIDLVYLAREGRISYGALNAEQLADFAPKIRALMLYDQTLPPRLRFATLAHHAVYDKSARNLLKAFYLEEGEKLFKDDELDALDKADWQTLALAYYILAEKKTAEADRSTEELTQNIFALEGYQDAMLPFTPYLAALSYADMEREHINRLFRLFILSGEDVPEPLASLWIENESDVEAMQKDVLFTLLAYLTTNNFAGLDRVPKELLIESIKALNPIESAFLQIITEKLDKRDKLHNYAGQDIYEKQAALTFGADYVMPSGSLVSSLQKAQEDSRLGEVILLSSIVLHGIEPENLRPDLFSDVMNSFVTVGLTNQAYQITREILLGFE